MAPAPNPDRYPALPEIEPHPDLWLDNWGIVEGDPKVEYEYRMRVRRAFVQNLIAHHPIAKMEEINEAISRRFGARVAHATLMKDMKMLGIVRAPMPGGGVRYRLYSQVTDLDLDQELNDRLRLDALSVKRGDLNVYVEVNRGTAQAFVQIFNLFIDDAALPDVYGLTSDQDKWVVLHGKDLRAAKRIERWLAPKLS